MARIEEEYLAQLRTAGLFVSPPYSPTHGFPDGVRVGKPTSTPGNGIPGFQDSYIVLGDAPLPPDMDAPMVVLFSTNDKWYVFAVDCAGGMGLGDFQNEWSTPQEAIEDIIDFYLGDPTRMNLKASRIAEVESRCSN